MLYVAVIGLVTTTFVAYALGPRRRMDRLQQVADPRRFLRADSRDDVDGRLRAAYRQVAEQCGQHRYS